MGPYEVQQPQKSKRKLLIVLGIVLLLIIPIVAGVAYFMISSYSNNETVSTGASAEQERQVQVASKKEVSDSISTLDKSLTQASTDQATAKAALKDATSQAKVAN